MAKIFFLEDEKMIREVLTEYMVLAGYEVEGCDNGDEAIEILNSKDFDLAILDIRVPGKTGLEVLGHIRRGSSKGMGVIMLTAFEDEATQVDAFNHFADDYITKPASPIILLKRIEVLLHRINAVESKNLEKIVIDDNSYKVISYGKDLNFTVTEFLIIKTFSDSPNRVFTREQLINIVFGDDYFGSDRIIDAHIKNIRKKLPYNAIETVIGMGYRWKGEEN